MTEALVVLMKKYGRTLTGREDGKKAFLEISSNYAPPIILDFDDVMALGSSFGDEVIPKLAIRQGSILSVRNANKSIQSCMKKILEDIQFSVKIDYVD